MRVTCACHAHVTQPVRRPVELKTARLTLLIDPRKKAAFERLCALQDRTASQVVRQLIRDYLAQHGVDYRADDAGAAPAAPPPPEVSPAEPAAETPPGPPPKGSRRGTAAGHRR